jgi:hypothetical protein
VLSANTTILDGVIDYSGIYFDIKAFGFHAYLAQRLKARLEEEIPGKVIFIEESWDLPIEQFEALINGATKIAAEVLTKGSIDLNGLRIRSEDPKPISVSGITIEPYRLAQENAKYAFLSANQFTRNAPFILMFALHPWFNRSVMHHDFAGADSSFTRAFARRTFMQFTTNAEPLGAVCSKVPVGTTFADAAALLSGMIFLNVWPFDAFKPGSSEGRLPPSWIYLNPRAAHPISRGTARLFATVNPHIGVDDFVYDDY